MFLTSETSRSLACKRFLIHNTLSYKALYQWVARIECWLVRLKRVFSQNAHNHGFRSQRSSFVARMTTEAIIIRCTLNHRNNNALDVGLQKNPDIDAWSQNDHFLDSWLQKEQFFDARTQKQSPKCSSAICLVTKKLVGKLIDRGVAYCSSTCQRRKIETRLPDKGRRSCARHLYTSQSSRRVCSLLSLKVTALSERGGRAEVTSTPLIYQHLFPCLITFSGVCSFSVRTH